MNELRWRAVWVLLVVGLVAGASSNALGQHVPLATRALRLGTFLLERLDLARRAGAQGRVACLDRTLSELNSLRRDMLRDRGGERRQNHTRSLQRLRDQVHRCTHPGEAVRQANTRVVSAIPAEPEQEPYWGP